MTKIEIDLQDRSYLQSLRKAAGTMAGNVLNERWIRAYLALADAVDTLDAMQARISVIQSEGRLLNIGIEAGVFPTCECSAPDCQCDQHSGCCGDLNEE